MIRVAQDRKAEDEDEDGAENQVENVVNACRTLWVIEELNKALKTGYGLEN